MGDPQAPGPSKGEEARAFLLLTAVLAPAMAVSIVVGYGFLVWMLQLIMGPPGH